MDTIGTTIPNTNPAVYRDSVLVNKLYVYHAVFKGIKGSNPVDGAAITIRITDPDGLKVSATAQP